VSTESREFDVILWGATGFVGRLTAEDLAARYTGSDVKWAIGGRNREKLEALRNDLVAFGGTSMAELPIVVADAREPDALMEIVKRTKVVCTTVGPYAKYGSAMVEACATTGTHYCDLTGEAQWIHKMIDRYHDVAKRSGARIVHCCGYDSIPSDVGTYVMQKAAMEKFGKPASRARMIVVAAKGGFSGGTIASVLNVMEESSDPEVRRVMGNAWSLMPEGERKGPRVNDTQGVRNDKDAGMWTAPFLMAPINAKIVRRTNALLDYKYGREFSYEERMKTGRGIKGALMATGITLGLGGFVGAVAIGPVRRLLAKTVLPKPGEGPSREAIANGYFISDVIGWVDGQTVRSRVKGQRDPGYGATATMLVESALCLASDALSSEGGILTPMSAMGDALIERLTAAGLQIGIVENA
jgi:short subunit dehydrogenase-like uncharacterized protein